MKSIVFLVLLLAGYCAGAQGKLLSGNYTSGDGNYTVTFTYNPDNTITVIEPNSVQVYQNVGGNEYKTISPRGTDFRLLVLDSKSARAYKALTPDNTTLYSYSGALIATVPREVADRYRKVGQKYLDLMKSDPKDAQLYSFCGAAALARATFNQDGYETYARKVILSLRLFLEDAGKCPCEDAIPKDLWDSVKE